MITEENIIYTTTLIIMKRTSAIHELDFSVKTKKIIIL